MTFGIISEKLKKHTRNVNLRQQDRKLESKDMGLRGTCLG